MRAWARFTRTFTRPLRPLELPKCRYLPVSPGTVSTVNGGCWNPSCSQSHPCLAHRLNFKVCRITSHELQLHTAGTGVLYDWNKSYCNAWYECHSGELVAHM